MTKGTRNANSPISSNIPLTDLHRHLDGNIRAPLIWSLAQANGIELPVNSVEELKALTTIQGQSSDLLSFLAKLEWGVSVLANENACYQVAYDNVVSAVEENLTYVELRFSPRFMAQQFSLSLDAVVEAVISGVEQGSKDYGLSCRLIGILSRTFGQQACMEELNSLLNFSNKLVAIDLAGDEKSYPAALFQAHFKKVRDKGLAVTVHAGEAAGPDSVWDAIHLLGAKRIGHGVAIIKDMKLVEHVEKHGIGIESCITSNYHTATWTDIASHPLKRFLASGLKVCLNTDDPAISAISIQDEYQKAKDVLGLKVEELHSIQKNGETLAFGLR